MKFRATLLAVTFGFLTCGSLTFGQEKKAKMDPNKPAGEQFKNVQILKEVPSGQFIQTMRSFNASLGVTCEFCHVDGDRSADTKPEKLMARKMLTMTHKINEENFNGKMEVRCFTMSQGRPASGI